MIRKGKYKHYSGRYYEVIGDALNTETREELVAYKALYDIPEGDLIFVRPTKMFLEDVEIDGKKVPRFEFIE